MKKLTVLIITGILTLSAGMSQASSVTIPNSFTAGTPAVAADVNANFSAVEAAVNDNDARISNLETGIVSVAAGAFHTRASELGCVDSGTASYYYTSGANCTAVAAIQIPNGVTLTELKCTVFDNVAIAGAQISVELKRYSQGLVLPLASTPVSTESVAYQELIDNTVNNAVIDNDVSYYYLEADFGTANGGVSVALFGCSVSYI